MHLLLSLIGCTFLFVIILAEIRWWVVHGKLGDLRIGLPSTIGSGPAYVYFVISGLCAVQILWSWSSAAEIRLWDALLAAAMFLCGVQARRAAAGLQIRRNGIDLGNVAFLWSDIDRWEKSKYPAEVHFWIRSPWRFLAVFRPSAPLKFRGGLIAEAEQILIDNVTLRPIGQY